MSRKYTRPENSYQALVNDDTKQRAGTHSNGEQWIRAKFDRTVKVCGVELAGAKGMPGVKENQIKTIGINVETTAIDIWANSG